MFLSLSEVSTVKLTRDNVSCTFTFLPLTDADGNPLIDEPSIPVRIGASYILTPYTPAGKRP